MSPWVWVVVALIVIALIAVVATMANKKKRERNRAQATELRQQALQEATDVQRKEALARESEAKAAAARAEAERKAAEAERLEAEAKQRAHSAGQRREQHQEQLRRADDLDPDVKHEAPTTAPVSGKHAGAVAEDTPPNGHRPDESHDGSTDDSRTTGGTHRAP